MAKKFTAAEAAVVEATRLVEAARLVEASRISKQVEELHDRIFNGFPREIRDEVRKEIGKVMKVVLVVLTGIVLSLVGVVIEGRYSAGRASEENFRNYRAILEVEKKIELHINTTDNSQQEQK